MEQRYKTDGSSDSLQHLSSSNLPLEKKRHSNKMKILTLALAVGLACASQHLDPVKINGDWRSIYIAADKAEKIEEGGELRAYFRHIECQDECRNLSIRFFVKLDRVCQEFTVVGVKDEKSGVYITDYAGKNYFTVVESTEYITQFSDMNVDEKGTKTNAVLIAAKRDSLTEEEKQKFVQLAEEKGIPTENIRNVIATDDNVTGVFAIFSKTTESFMC
ncbi:female-specific lacrimal gland protein [Heterocephalus glaber]|uniref:Female-specific lacrimal gland protein n=1 Tax=Heterocephalus glaber TaxID=10181 RepID=A0AAX6Q896_HETGA|nr:female-specific lacrimal gland protein [Heterocephalus glaber]